MHRDAHFMAIALKEARKGAGHTSPNPAVGAVVTRGNRLLAKGYHRKAGMPHAEVEALRKAKNPSGATLYVTLEPCSTHGRTPPCVEAIIKAGIRRVVVGTTDPNPAHAGRGLKILADAGVEVVSGVLEEECRGLNPGFNKWIVHKIPYVIAKCGMSLDGRLTRPPGEGQWLTSPRSRADAMSLRRQVDAILIGGQTLRMDNPRLTVRGTRGTRQPLRVILSRTGNLPKDAHVFTDEFKDRTVVFQGLSLSTVLKKLGRQGVTSVLIEGGMNVLGQAFDRHLVDRVQFYIAQLISGGPVVCVGGHGASATAEALKIIDPVYRRIGDDICLTGTLR